VRAHAAVDEEDDDLGLLGSHERLRADRGLELVDVARLDTTGIDEHEVLAVPVGPVIAAIARHTTGLVDDGVRALGDAVHEGRLAHVGTADDCDDR